eukprot:TRINITY_DN2767_c0_g1_i1.p1 TRINITY_DN2767_c0_g1~~TRINITY_DN2767_c0_g1_i1.p1  ORF type:complete len:308 (+),score=134.81 TRINITY_DN2767_c0_g1_i1:484-1407(+)
MSEYKGKDSDYNKILKIYHEREKQKKEIEKKRKMENETTIVDINEKFTANVDTTLDDLKNETIGLYTRDEFRKKRLKNEIEKRQKEEKENVERERRLANRKEHKKNQDKVKNKLSFQVEEEEEEEEEIHGEEILPSFGKDPTIDTHFLPDKIRDELVENDKQKQEEEWKIKQEEIKNEEFILKYSFFNGTKSKSECKIKKGWTIAHFLEKAKRDIYEIKKLHINKLLFIKEEMIIPHHLTFYDLALNKTKGRNGVIIEFGPNSSEKSTMPMIVERTWYDNNKHIFPSNRWLLYDPSNSVVEKRDEKI